VKVFLSVPFAFIKTVKTKDVPLMPLVNVGLKLFAIPLFVFTIFPGGLFFDLFNEKPHGLVIQ
jgi:hypothetical protein